MLITKNKQNGFTLLELLIALFVFTILSMMLMSALHNIINIQSGTEANAARLRQVQVAMLLMQRDVEQTVERPIINAAGKEEQAVVGTPQGFTLTHMGFANPLGTAVQSSLQRTRYYWSKEVLVRQTWASVDMAAGTPSRIKPLLYNVTGARFSYLDKEGQFREQWPVQGRTKQGLPLAIKVDLTIAHWGSLSQIYIIPVTPAKKDDKKDDKKDEKKEGVKANGST